VTSLWTTSLTHFAELTASVQTSWSVWKFLILVYILSGVEGLLLLGCCPSLYVTIGTHNVSHAFQGSAKHILFPSVCCSQAFRLKGLWSNSFFPFTKGFLNGRLQWNLWRMASNRRQLRTSNRFTWLTNVPKMFGYRPYKRLWIKITLKSPKFCNCR
jgi:hypothetical protein